MLHAIDEAAGLWDATAELALPAGLRLPVRMTVVRLPDGTLLLHSPIAIDDALAAELDALGPVRHLVAPNKVHSMFLAAAKARYPQARVYAAPGLGAKRRKLPIDAELSGTAPPQWGGALETCALDGIPSVNEVIFLHRAGGTLICSDLVFNMQRWNGALTGVWLGLFGTRGRLAVSRLFRMVAKDRSALLASLAPLRRWRFRRIAMAHGELYESEQAAEHLLGALEQRFGAPVPSIG